MRSGAAVPPAARKLPAEQGKGRRPHCLFSLTDHRPCHVWPASCLPQGAASGWGAGCLCLPAACTARLQGETVQPAAPQRRLTQQQAVQQVGPGE